MDSLSGDIDQASTPKKMRSSRMNSQEEMTVLIKNENRGGQRQNKSIVVTLDCTKWALTKVSDLVSACPSKRWCHTVCLSDPCTAILIGGETSEQNYCEDSLWKLEIGQWSLLDGIIWGGISTEGCTDDYRLSSSTLTSIRYHDDHHGGKLFLSGDVASFHTLLSPYQYRYPASFFIPH